MSKRIVATALSVAMALCGTAQAADVQVLNADGPGVGLNSTAPAAPVGGNTATTVGGQRLRVYQYATALWGSVLGSNAPVVVQASFAALSCSPTSGVLGSAGPVWSATSSTRRYHGALANAISDGDLAPGLPEINSQFNSELGTASCLTSLGWYYGLDGNTPAGKINFLNVVMHEIGHGLGVAGYINKTNGVISGVPDVYTAMAYNNITGKSFIDPTTTSAERATAMRTVGATVWDGVNVNQQAALFLDGGYQEASLTVTAPAPLARTYGFYTSNGNFGPAPSAANFNGQWVLATDAAELANAPDGLGVGTATDGCTAITNAIDIAGKIAMIDRGRCGYAVKVKNAQVAGATAVVILNSQPDSNWAGMGGTDPSITIPAIIVRQSDGAAFKANAPITGGMVNGAITLAGMDVNGRTRLYSPWIVATGSTFSHFDTALSPNVLMEPFDTPQVQAQLSLDLTPALLKDIGWPMNSGNAKMGSPNVSACDTGVPAYEDGGLIPGAAVQAAHKLCLTTAQTRMQYTACITNEKNKMVASGLLTSQQGLKIMMCARKITDHQRFPIPQ